MYSNYETNKSNFRKFCGLLCNIPVSEAPGGATIQYSMLKKFPSPEMFRFVLIFILLLQ